jgi:hypothetical protein
MTVSKDDLLKPRIGEGDLTVPDVGTFRIRPLTRAQAFEVQELREVSVLDAENLLISYGLVEPAMTQDEVARWAECAPGGELAAVSMGIGKVSGMMPGSGKESYKSVRKRPRS